MVCALIVAAVGAPSAGAAPKRLYKGKTTQKRPVRITMRGNTLKLRHFTAQLKCKGGARLIVDESGFQRTRLHGAHFNDVQVGNTDEVFFRGAVQRKVVSGRIRVKDRLHKRGPRCASRWLKFHARLR
ncbi:MAG TPA: hypothetical protein VFI09_05575 [Solirubrobacterales bacterium]|nr:hypothetical protein [Solirubrobacterales bacterium]